MHLPSMSWSYSGKDVKQSAQTIKFEKFRKIKLTNKYSVQDAILEQKLRRNFVKANQFIHDVERTELKVAQIGEKKIADMEYKEVTFSIGPKRTAWNWFFELIDLVQSWNVYGCWWELLLSIVCCRAVTVLKIRSVTVLKIRSEERET